MHNASKQRAGYINEERKDLEEIHKRSRAGYRNEERKELEEINKRSRKHKEKICTMIKQ